MLPITPTLAISENELSYDFIRASGPGGQNINKVATAVQLSIDVRNSPSLPEEVKRRLAHLAGRRMTRDGILIILARRFRAQEQNRADAEYRLVTLIQKAAIQPVRRHPTCPSAASQRRRVDSKKRHGMMKRIRQKWGNLEE
jgi:ribosome-associated protein